MLALFVNIEGAWLIILRTGRILPLLTFLYINNLSQGKYHIYDKMKTILRGRGLSKPNVQYCTPWKNGAKVPKIGAT